MIQFRRLALLTGIILVVAAGVMSSRTINIRPDSIDYGCVLPGETGWRQFRIENESGRTLNGVQIIIPHSPFLVANPSPPSGPFNLDIGETRSFNAFFLPDRTGSWVDSISIIAGGEVEVLRLTGRATAPPKAQAFPVRTPVAFGSVMVGDTLVDTLVFGNSGCRDLLLLSKSMTGSSDFQIVSPTLLPDTLSASNRHMLVVRYAPTSAGPASATLRLQTRYLFRQSLFPPGDSAVFAVDTTIFFTGTGVLLGLQGRPSSIDFDSVSIFASPPVRRLVVVNPDNIDVTISAVTLGGPNRDEFALDSTPVPIVLAGKNGRIEPDTMSIDVSFTPTAPGPRIAELRFTTSHGTFVVPVEGFGISPPRVEMTPRKIDFGGAMAGSTHTLFDTVRVINFGGDGPVRVDSIVMSGPERHAFSVTPGATTIDVDDTAYFTVSFAPDRIGRFDARATILLSSDERLALDLEGVGTPAGVSVTPRRIDFRALPLSTTSFPRFIEIVNLTPVPVQIDTIGLFGGEIDQFLVTLPTFPRVLRANALDTFRIPVRFAPTGSAGMKTSSVVIRYGSESEQTLLRGEGVSRGPSLQPRIVDAGDVHPGGTRTLVDTLELLNPTLGGAPFAVDSITVEGNDAQSFTVTGPTGGIIDPGSSARFTVSFSPDTVRRYTAQGNMHVSLGYSIPIGLTGNGLNASFTVGPADIVFAPRPVATTSAEEITTITNLSQATRRVDTVMLDGNNAGDFTISRTDPLTIGGIGQGNQWEAAIAFTPGATGLRTGRLLVVLDGPDTAIILLEGTGLLDGVTVNPSSVDFGDVRAGTTRTVTSAVTVTNGSGAPITVVGAGVRGNDIGSFAATIVPGTIPVGGSLDLDVMFSPSEVRAYGSSAVILLGGNEEIVVPLSGTGWLPAQFTLRIDTVYTEVAMQRPLRGMMDPPLSSADGITGFRIVLQMSAVSLHIIDVTPATTLVTRLGGDTVVVQGESSGPITGIELFRLQFEGLVGGRSENPVLFVEGELLGGQTELTGAGGLVVLSGCDIAHPVAFGRPARVVSLTPNPIRGVAALTYEAAEGGHPWLRVIDVMGATVRRLELPTGTGQLQTTDVSLGDLPQGFYLVELRVGTQRSSVPVVVAP